MIKSHHAALEGDIMMQIMALKKARGLSQVDIAQKLGCTNVAVYNWEVGICYPLTFSRWQELAESVGAKLTIRLEAE